MTRITAVILATMILVVGLATTASGASSRLLRINEGFGANAQTVTVAISASDLYTFRKVHPLSADRVYELRVTRSDGSVVVVGVRGFRSMSLSR